MKIEIKEIKKQYAKTPVLTGACATVQAGEYIAIAGDNGSGKSTLLSILAGTLPGQGAFFCDGIDLLCAPKVRERLVGYVPQTPPLFEELSAKDHLRLYYSRAQLSESLCGGVAQMLGIGDFLRTSVRKMSGGMKKRLSVACAVAHNPRILLLDEVSAALDPGCRESIYQYLRTFCEQGGIVISVSHDVGELMRADRCYTLRGGALHPMDCTDHAELLQVLGG